MGFHKVDYEDFPLKGVSINLGVRRALRRAAGWFGWRGSRLGGWGF